MRQRIVIGVALILLATAAAIITRSFSSGQPPGTPPESGAVKPASYDAPAGKPAMPEALRRIHVSARSGAEWLVRLENPANGRFHPGWVPALNVPVDHDSYLYQASATYALARAARYYGDGRYLMKARQATLSLLAETQPDPNDPSCRFTSLPPVVVNRLAAAGLLLMTIHELQSPADELLKQGEELANFIRKQQ